MRITMNRSLYTVLALSLFSGACGNYRSLKSKVIGHQSKASDATKTPHYDETEELRLEDKWVRLLGALGFEAKGVKSQKELISIISQPSKLLEPGNAQYDKLLKGLKDDLTKNRGRMRCGGIQSFTRLQDAAKVEMKLHESDVFHMVYRDQNTTVDRNALVLLPQSSTQPLPLLLHLVGGDTGLMPQEKTITDFTAPMLAKHIVIAPDYNMGICEAVAGVTRCGIENHLVKPTQPQQDKPWEEDVYSSMAAHNCVVEAVSTPESRMNPETGAPASFDTQETLLRTELQSRGLQVAMIAPSTAKNLRSVNAMLQAPLSHIFGTSRGALVGFLVAAWAGIEWEAYYPMFLEAKLTQPESELLKAVNVGAKKLFTSENCPTYSKTILQYPPMFSSLVDNAGPFSLMASSFRVLVEQIVKKIHNPLKADLPGVRHMLPDFALYTEAKSDNDQKELDDVALLIFRRDMHFLYRYLYVGLLNWNDLLVAGFDPTKMGQGKLLLLHSKQDKIIPSTQVDGALYTFAETDKIREDLQAKQKAGAILPPEFAFFAALPGIAVTPALTKSTDDVDAGIYHNDEAFWNHTTIKGLSPEAFLDQWMQ